MSDPRSEGCRDLPFLKDKSAPDLYTRERIELEDGDFLDLDWIRNQSRRLLILSHGIEGNSQSYYVKRAAVYFSKRGWDILAWNFRSCGKELNRTPKLYHIGDTEDLGRVIELAISKDQHNNIVLIGYSMGGSMILKYLGEKTRPMVIKGAITFSVPCNFMDSLCQSEKLTNQLYVRKILSKLKRKLITKLSILPGGLMTEEIEKVKSIREFNEKVILPLYGYSSVASYAEIASCDRYLSTIKVPAFIGNARNDPLLGKDSYPIEVAKNNGLIHLEIPAIGGHLGFTSTRKKPNWMEHKAEAFLEEFISL